MIMSLFFDSINSCPLSNVNYETTLSDSQTNAPDRNIALCMQAIILSFTI